MNLRREVSFACVLVLILGIVDYSNARPASEQQPTVSSHPSTVEQANGNAPSSFVVPQVGYLEERTNIDDNNVKPAKDAAAAAPSGNSGNGILVPIVSVINGDSPKSGTDNGIGINGNNPLVALLPAPSVIGQGQDPNKLPVIATLPVLPPYDDQAQFSKPEIRQARSDYTETMDVAEDIVFRPLFKIRQNNAAKNSYTMRNLRRNNRPNYQRYNVNGYYRLPYNYFRYNYNNNINDDYQKRSLS